MLTISVTFIHSEPNQLFGFSSRRIKTRKERTTRVVRSSKLPKGPSRPGGGQYCEGLVETIIPLEVVSLSPRTQNLAQFWSEVTQFIAPSGYHLSPLRITLALFLAVR